MIRVFPGGKLSGLIFSVQYALAWSPGELVSLITAGPAMTDGLELAASGRAFVTPSLIQYPCGAFAFHSALRAATSATSFEAIDTSLLVMMGPLYEYVWTWSVTVLASRHSNVEA